MHPTLFHTTRERLFHLDPQRRGIAYDDRSGDCLDNQELKRVVGAAHQLLGRKVDRARASSLRSGVAPDTIRGAAS